MKKRSLNIGKKLFLNKVIVSDLSHAAQKAIKGGESEQITCIYNMCQNTAQVSCRTNCVTLAGVTCTPDTICQDTGVSCISCQPGSGCPTDISNCTCN